MSKNIHHDKILIIDFGSQYTQLIARRIREAGVYCEIHPFDADEDFIRGFGAKGIILSGGPDSAHGDASPSIPSCVLSLGVPVLGICYGMQAMAAQCGGRVAPAAKREFGFAKVEVHHHSPLLTSIDDQVREDGVALLDVWMSHGDFVTQLPEGFITIANTDNAPIAGMADLKRRFYGLQFHPEVTHTKQGARILSRFVIDICGCEALWTAENIIDDAIARVREQVGQDDVILGLSGGVDSAVVAMLLHKAIGDKLTCVFVDNGLLRQDEAKQVLATFGEHFGICVIHVEAEQTFLSKLEGVSDPETKRKIIGNTFIEIFEEEAKRNNSVKWLAQGTIYPDVIESAGAKTGKAKVIKSHHNVGGLPERMNMKLVEPLRELFKDEVREIGLTLGLPYELVYRHPFPGPGLAVRVLGEIKQEYLEILRAVDVIFIEALRNNDLYQKVSQAFAVFLPVKSVGVIGDARQYEYVVALRAVETVDFMTAKWSHLPYELLGYISNRIINEVKGVSRVTYDISGKPPATIEWE